MYRGSHVYTDRKVKGEVPKPDEIAAVARGRGTLSLKNKFIAAGQTVEGRDEGWKSARRGPMMNDESENIRLTDHRVSPGHGTAAV